MVTSNHHRCLLLCREKILLVLEDLIHLEIEILHNTGYQPVRQIMNEIAQSSGEYISPHFVLAACNSSLTVMVLCSQNQTILISDQQFTVKLERKAL